MARMISPNGVQLEDMVNIIPNDEPMFPLSMQNRQSFFDLFEPIKNKNFGSLLLTTTDMAFAMYDAAEGFLKGDLSDLAKGMIGIAENTDFMEDNEQEDVTPAEENEADVDFGPSFR